MDYILFFPLRVAFSSEALLDPADTADDPLVIRCCDYLLLQHAWEKNHVHLRSCFNRSILGNSLVSTSLRAKLFHIDRWKKHCHECVNRHAGL